ncbi:MAG TPA: SsrA-binding protein SmpB [Candidatus Brocadiia bacterium]|nr:SsrA-binding protein SmpB [Candidatus Brocadiia bacterium]
MSKEVPKTDGKQDEIVPIARNRAAGFKYELLERFEAGLVLTGTEVKSLRNGQASIAEAFVRPVGNDLLVIGMTIPPYEQGNRMNHVPDRPRKLLMHKREIARLRERVKERGLTLAPTSLYFKRGYAKLQFALAKGKQAGDKRETIKKREAKREMDRAMRRR